MMMLGTPSSKESVSPEFFPRWPLIGIVGQTVIYKTNAFLAHSDIWGEIQCRLLLPFKLIFVLCLFKWRVTCYHFEKNSPKRPNIGFVIIYTAIQYLGSHIYGSATISRVEIVINIWKNFRKPEISYLDQELMF